MHNTTVGIADDCNDVLTFLQSGTLKVPQVLASPLSLQAVNHACGWFRLWGDSHLKQHPTHHKRVSQDHSSLVGVFSEVLKRLQNTEALCPVVAVQRDSDMEPRVWDYPPPISWRLIITASTVDGLIIQSALPASLYRLLNTRNTTELQTDCTLTYLGNNIFLTTAFFQSLL